MPRPLALLTLACSTACLIAQDPGTSYLYRIASPIQPGLHARLLQDFDVLEEHSGAATSGASFDVVVSPARRTDLLALAPTAQLVARGQPFAAIQAARLAAAATDGGPDPSYYTVAEIEQALDAQVAAFPGLAQKVDLTTWPGAAPTHEGRSIFALKISDHVAIDEDEPAILVVAQHHARELNTPHIVLGAIDRILQGYASDPSLAALVDGHELWFVPTVNPDGVEHVWNVDNFWRKNRRDNGSSYGVDLNRNYPTGWDSACRGSTRDDRSTYRGPSPASEPETQTMRACVAALRPELYLDFHSFGREVLFPYSPCSLLDLGLFAFFDARIQELLTPMYYGTRPASAAAEAPEDHWTSSGALSFLIEVGDSFQPVFADTTQEEQRVWSGLRHALTNWKPALRGHVRAAYSAAPIEAEITVAGALFQQGERTMSRARDGRYGLWLPIGSWNVTWTAPGHLSTSQTIVVTSLDTPQQLDVTLLPDWQPATLTKVGTDQLGTTTSLTYSSPGDGGALVWIALSGGTSPGLAIGARTLPLNGDGLFVASSFAPGLIDSNVGVLPTPGESLTASLFVPPLPILAGLQIYAGGITFDSGYPLGVKRWSDAVGIVFGP